MKRIIAIFLLAQSLFGATLEEKIAQMIMIGFDGTAIDKNSPIYHEIAHNKIGGVILFDYDLQTKSYDKNIKSKKQLITLTKYLQNISKDKLFIAIDYEGGKVNRLKQSKGFIPTYSQKKLGEKNDSDFTYTQTKKMAKLLKQLGINVNFAPVVDLCINPNNPVIAKTNRCYSDNAGTVTAHAKAAIKAYKEFNILPVIKHFPGHGSSNNDSHTGFVDVSSTYEMKELIPYKNLIRKDFVQAIMSAHVFNESFDPNHPATLSHKTLTQLLQNKLNFKGIIFSDDLQMKAISQNYSFEKTLRLLINAGVNVIVIGNNLQKYNPNTVQSIITIVKKLVHEKKINILQIEKSYDKIVKLKQEL